MSDDVDKEKHIAMGIDTILANDYNLFLQAVKIIREVNLLYLQILTKRFEFKGDLYNMKATDIIHRIEARVIITQKSLKTA